MTEVEDPIKDTDRLQEQEVNTEEVVVEIDDEDQHDTNQEEGEAEPKDLEYVRDKETAKNVKKLQDVERLEIVGDTDDKDRVMKNHQINKVWNLKGTMIMRMIMRAKMSLRKCEMLEMTLVMRKIVGRLRIMLWWKKLLHKNQSERKELLYQMQIIKTLGRKILWRKFYYLLLIMKHRHMSKQNVSLEERFLTL